MTKKICRTTQTAIEDIFFGHEIGTREDALTLIKEIVPEAPDHIDECRKCNATLEAHITSVELTEAANL